MNLRFLETVIAFSEQPSLTATGEALGLSHSAVSLQIKALEDEIGIQIIDRSTRPAKLSDDGLALVGYARQLGNVLSDIRSLSTDHVLDGVVTMGVVPSALTGLFPPVLKRLTRAHPKLQVRIRSGLSEQLVAATTARDLDLAVVTEPLRMPEGLAMERIGSEPLDIIAPEALADTADDTLLTEQPFIWFSRRTWAGQQIERHLLSRGIQVNSAMEVDSIDAVETLVAHGLGVSITPRRLIRPGPQSNLVRRPFGAPQLHRHLCLIRLARSPRRRVADALTQELNRLAAQA